MEKFELKDVIIYKVPHKSIINKSELKELSDNTANTWQPNRPKKEIIANTTQGKIAEEIFSNYINKNAHNEFEYISYDEIRKDKRLKHAPFDGLIYKKENDDITKFIAKITSEIDNNDYGKISVALRNELRSSFIRTVEIKSSKIPKADYRGVDTDSLSKIPTAQKLIDNFSKRDFFVYPHYSRYSENIESFEDYIDYISLNNYQFKNIDKKEVRESVLKIEKENSCDIYTRIFFDKSEADYDRAFLFGYINGPQFYRDPVIIGRMPQKNKSEYALYFQRLISEGKKISHLFKDEDLWL